jgi:hypothetical protein
MVTEARRSLSRARAARPRALAATVVRGDHSDDDAEDDAIEGEVVAGAGAAADGVAPQDLMTLLAQVVMAFGATDETLRGQADKLLEHASLVAYNGEVYYSAPFCSYEAGDRDPLLGLLRPWPLPEGAFADDSEVREHDFAEVHLWKPTWCDQCARFIKETKGFRCKGCKFEVHLDGPCRKEAQAHPCMRPADIKVAHKALLERDPGNVGVKHVHTYRERRVHKTHTCALCDSFIMLLTKAYQCHLCNTYAHTECAAKCQTAIVEETVQTPNK